MTHVAALGMVLVAATEVLLLAGDQQKPPTPRRPVASQPATTQPASAPRTMRKPQQAEIIENLLRERERSSLILPQEPQAVVGQELAASQPSSDRGTPGLLADGTTVVERPGQLAVEEGRPRFVFYAEGDEPKLRTMEILPNHLLEAMEREAQGGRSEFVISGEVMRYKGRNYVLLRKVLRRVGHGNLAP
jgi:hypothetical protein